MSDKSTSQPPTPVIPDEVEGFLQNCISHMVGVAFGLDEPKKNEILEKVKAARAWLAQCQTATDKEVCPMCGGENCQVSPQGDEMFCHRCSRYFVISPPREVNHG